MKKFAKGCFLTAISMFFIGIIILIICIIIGGNSLFHYLKNEGLQNDSFSKLFNGTAVTFHNGESNIDFSEHYKTHSGKHANMQVATASEVKNLDIDLGGGMCIISESPDDFFHIYTDNANKFQYYTENNTLYLKGFDKFAFEIHTDDYNAIYLDIPKNFSFENINIELGTGYLEAHCLIATNEINLEVGAGEIITKSLNTDSFSLILGAGNVEIENGDTKDANITVGLGNMTYHGILSQDLTAECGMGNLELFLNDSYESHNYYIDCALGNLTLHESSLGSIAYSKHIEHNADSTYTLTCSMGNMNILFE